MKRRRSSDVNRKNDALLFDALTSRTRRVLHRNRQPAEGDSMTSKLPAAQFRDDVSHLATEFLTQRVPAERVAEASGRLALALRQVAVANPKIYECDRTSIAQAVAMSALTGLQPGGVKPDVYLIPRGRQLQWQVSARGLQKLYARAGWVRMVAQVVHLDDEYRVVLGSEDRIEHVPCGKYPTGLDEVRAVYVVGQHRDGYKVCVDVPMGAIIARKKKSQSGNVWAEWPLEMAQKTAVTYAISRGHFGALEDQSDIGLVLQHEANAYENRQPERPALTHHTVDTASVLDSLPALPSSLEVES
jgi:recombinational DNA repair protein RecT